MFNDTLDTNVLLERFTFTTVQLKGI